MDFLILSLFSPVFNVTSIFPSPPAGMSFCERRTPVHPHPAFIFSIISCEFPVFLNVKICFSSVFCLTFPKSWLISLNLIRGSPKHAAKNKSKNIKAITILCFIIKMDTPLKNFIFLSKKLNDIFNSKKMQIKKIYLIHNFEKFNLYIFSDIGYNNFTGVLSSFTKINS
jgi:hypothetical protein